MQKIDEPNLASRLKKKYIRKTRKYIETLVNNRWNNYPYGRKPWASRECYLELAANARKQQYLEIEEFEAQQGFSIEEEWLHELALSLQVCIKTSPICYAHGRVLYSALSNYLSQSPAISSAYRCTIWETGTAKGFSSTCMAKALADQGRAGTIITFDRLPHRSRMYWNCIDDNEKPKTRAELLSPWQDLVNRYIIFHEGDTYIEMPKVNADRINFGFLDGAHTYEDVWFEFEQIRDAQHRGDLIVYDDYNPNQYPGLVRAVDEICSQHNYQRTDLKAHPGRGYVVAVKE